MDGKKTPIYCYPTSEWAPQYQDLRNNQGNYVKTLTSRIMAIVVVFKKTRRNLWIYEYANRTAKFYSTRKFK